MVAESKKGGPQRSDEAYMQGVTPAGQVGKWARLVPAFGTRVKYRRFRLGLMDGSAQMVSRRTHKLTQLRQICLLVCSTAPHAGSWSQGTMFSCTAPGPSWSGTMPSNWPVRP